MRLRVRLRKNEKQMERKRKASEMDFASLIQAIRTTHEHFAAQAVRAVNIGLTLRNWSIGAHIAEFELRGADRAHYGDRLLDELSHELRKADISNTGRRQLYQYLAFFRTYPQIARTVPAQSGMLLPEATGLQKKVRTASAQSAIPPETLMNQLSYSHFELLIGLDDDLKRRFYEVGSIRGQWSVRELKSYVTWFQKHEMTAGDNPPVGLLLCTRKNHALIEYALAGMDNQLFVSRYQLELPKKEELERFLEAKLKDQGSMKAD